MDSQLIRAIQAPFIRSEIPEVRTGMDIEVHQIIKEGNKERTQKFRGIVIRVAGKTPLERTVIVRKDIDGIGVEKVFALQAPSVARVDIIRSFKVRRKHIGFIRALTGKAARLKEIKTK